MIGWSAADDGGRPPRGAVVTGERVSGGTGEQQCEPEGSCGEGTVGTSQPPERGVAADLRRMTRHGAHAVDAR